MQSTRERIIELLRHGQGAAVEDITRELALAPATVRRHLDVLLRDGLVEMWSERVPLGRPRFVFSLTESGRESLPGHQLNLVAAVIDTILELTPADTEGRSGKEIAELVFDRLAVHLIDRCKKVVTASKLDQRVEQAVGVLAVAGIDFEAAPCDDGWEVRGSGCPCMRLVSGRQECAHESSVLSGLIGAEVERVVEAEKPYLRSYFVRTAG